MILLRRRKLARRIQQAYSTFPILFLCREESINNQKLVPGFLTGEVLFQGRLTLGKEVKMLITDAKHLEAVYHFIKENNLLGKIFICEKKDFLKLQLARQKRQLPALTPYHPSRKGFSLNWLGVEEVREPSKVARKAPGFFATPSEEREDDRRYDCNSMLY